MSSTSPPLEAQRFGRSQTPESPRPIAIPEPANIPVLQNQMDPIFNDTATYDIRPDSQPSMAFKNTSSDSSELHYEDLNAKSQALQQTLLNDHAEAQNRAEALLETKDARDTMPDQVDQTSSFAPANSVIPPLTNEHVAQVTESSGAVHNLQGSTRAGTAAYHAAEDQKPAVNTEQNSIDYESILASIDAPSAENVPVTANALQQEHANASSAVEKALLAAVGLPPKPPLPEKPANFADHNVPDSYSSSYQPKPSASAAVSHKFDPLQTLPTAAPNGLPPPPSLSSQPPGISTNHNPPDSKGYNPSSFVPQPSATERPWGPEVQQMYDKFLDDERMYVTEGVWDKFPLGSRLFVGNLPTEKVTKRDLFHIFYKYGQLAQISIKQAYGFVQFLLAADCQAALQAEQGVELRERLLHLEISKPQKNTRNANAGGNRGGQRRRSRSPDRAMSRLSADRTGYGRPPYSDYRNEPVRKRDDYRPPRSPSPRSFRSRDEYRSRDDRYDGQARSPHFGNNSMPGPEPPILDEDALLPLPRRAPRDVPDVQLLVLEDVGQQFVSYVEQGFRSKGLTAQTTWLNARLTLGAVVKRQIIEGVQAVVKLTRNMQYSSKIPLQVFDRTPGTTNVNFNEYIDLDISIAADIVLQARQKERMNQQRPSPSPYPQQTFQSGQMLPQFHQPPPLQSPYGQTPQPHFQPPRPQNQQFHQPQNPQYSIPQASPQTPNGGGSNLQELLANLNRQPPGSQSQSQATPTQATPDLAGLLQNVAARQQNQATGVYGQGQSYGPSPPQQPQYGQYPAPQQNQHFGNPSQQPQQNVQNIMDQLARYSR